MVTGVGTITQQTMSTVANQQTGMPLKEAPPPPPVKSDRRSNKPIMEKRRRARINNCLNELKTLILDATKKDPARHSKLEKADILEKTVKHLQELQRQQAAMAQAVDPKIVNKFKAGFTECANEVSRFPGLDAQVKRRLMQHLSNCINGVKTELSQIRQQQQQQQPQQQQHTTNLQPIQPAQVHILPSPPSSPEQDHHQRQHNNNNNHIPQVTTTISATQIQSTPNGYFLPNGIQVYPTKLANGTFALILPQQQQQLQHHQPQHHQQIITQQSQLPMLVPIPNRTASTGSATSSSSGYERIHSPSTQQIISNHNGQHINQQQQIHYAPPSPANSYEAMDCHTQYNTQSQQHQSVIHHASTNQNNLHRQSPLDNHHHQNQYHMHHQQLQQHHQPSQYSHDLDDGSAPLSLVIKKHIKEEEQPWRPWGAKSLSDMNSE